MREDGLTIIEVVVAGLILVVGALGVLGIVDAATRNTYRAEQSQVVSNVLQAEMEKLRQVPYEELALTSLPVHSGDPGDPSWRVDGTSFATVRSGSEPRQLVYNGGSDGTGTVEGGTVAAGPTPFTVEDVSGTISRYVVWDACPSSLCQDGEFLKRAIVAVEFDSGVGGVRRYQEIQGQIADPEAEPPTNPGPDPGGAEAQPWTVWLTDTPCSHATRQPLTGNHQAHNTRGSCTAGLKMEADCTTVLFITKCPPGAPDLMVESAPPDVPEAPLYDYATDVEPLADADKDVGLTLRKSSGGCNALTSLWGQLPLVPELLDGEVFQKVHKWVSPPIPGGVELELQGSGTLSLWTKSINGAVHPAKLCAALFTRQLSVDLFGNPLVVDTPAVNLDLADGLFNLNYFTYQAQQWPSDGWTELNIPMNFTLNAGLLPGRRLGLALWLAGSGTSGDGIELMYDERSFDGRLELDIDQTVSLPIFG